MVEDVKKRDVILLCGSFTSANFYVMLSVIRSLGDVHIHAISANNDDEYRIPNEGDITCYPIHNWRISLLSKIEKLRLVSLSKFLVFLFYRVTEIFDNYFSSSYERAIYKKSIEIIEKQKIDAIFSVCLRFYTHRIAAKLNKEIGIKWLQFWVDPFSNRKNGSKIWLAGAKKLEREFLSEASKIYALPEVFVNSDIINEFNHKLVTFEIPYLVNRSVERRTKDIVFAGAFIKGIREPGPVLELLLSISNEIDEEIKFHFYIQKKDDYLSYTEKSKGKICFHNYIGHDELYSILGDSMMLLSIGNAGSIQMPSKTVEYISFRKPLLFFFKDENDPSLRYLSYYPDICCINVDGEFEKNRGLLLDFLNKNHNDISYEQLMNIDVYRKSTPHFIKEMMYDLL